MKGFSLEEGEANGSHFIFFGAMSPSLTSRDRKDDPGGEYLASRQSAHSAVSLLTHAYLRLVDLDSTVVL